MQCANVNAIDNDAFQLGIDGSTVKVIIPSHRWIYIYIYISILETCQLDTWYALSVDFKCIRNHVLHRLKFGGGL